MFNNLEAEIARKKINKKLIASTIGRSYSTLTSKISGKFPFTYDEALKIQEVFFPECDIKDLFKKYI
ncbi:hypothetical protein [Clostridium sp.]|uniref:hypothetical protein n=1 Tax=Clostridium sp. TaxID=1506 RepID=UPI003F680C23